MWLVSSGIIILLLAITIQDLKSRLVYVVSFPFLTVLFISYHFVARQPFLEVFRSLVFNLAFLGIQFSMLWVLFFLKYRNRTNILSEMIGWGDILFLISIAFYLSALNYVLFYILSLCVICLFWMSWQLIFSGRNDQVPLAGLQSLQLAMLLIFDSLNKTIDLTTDSWLMDYFQ